MVHNAQENSNFQMDFQWSNLVNRNDIFLELDLHCSKHCRADIAATVALGVLHHILIMVIVSHVGPVFLLEGLALTLSRDTWTVHIFPIVAHVPLSQMVRCKGL
jgi:hypothetical protein